MTSFSLGAAFLLGLFGGVHCLLMCGGIVALLTSGLPKADRSWSWARLRLVLAYNAGRVGVYTLLGVVGGAVGASVLAAQLRTAQWVLRAFAALLLVAIGFSLAGFVRRVALIERAGRPLGRIAAEAFARLTPVRSAPRAVLLGLGWGMMPCGLVYAAVALAVGTGSVGMGALTMLAFGAGTLPALLLTAGAVDAVRRFAKNVAIKRTAGVLVALSGVVQLALVAQVAFAPPLAPAKAPCGCGHPKASR